MIICVVKNLLTNLFLILPPPSQSPRLKFFDRIKRMLIAIIVVVILFLILPPKLATLLSIAFAFMYHQKRLRFSNVGDTSSVNVMGDSYITVEGEETLERIKMRHNHEQGRRLRDLYAASKADDRMEKISHMMIQADKAESNDKPIASRTLEYPYSQRRRRRGLRKKKDCMK